MSMENKYSKQGYDENNLTFTRLEIQFLIRQKLPAP